MKVYRRSGQKAPPVSDEEEEEAGDEVCLNFQRQGQSNIANMKIKELEGRIFEFTYFDIINESDIANEASLEVKAGDLKVMQTLVKYAMPCLLGWNSAMDPKVAGLFFKAFTN